MSSTAPRADFAAVRSPWRPTAYGRGAQAFHWATVLLLAALVSIGLYASNAGDGPVRSYLLDSWHKPFGLLILALTVARIAWKWLHPSVPEAAGLARWEAGLSRLMHWALYAIVLAMPLSGLLMSQAAGRPTSFFGLFDLPQLLAVDPALKPREQHWYKVGKSLHDLWFQWSLYLLVAVHFAAALKHQFTGPDRAYYRRMWHWRG